MSTPRLVATLLALAWMGPAGFFAAAISVA